MGRMLCSSSKMQKKEAAPRHGFIFQQVGHLQRNCPKIDVKTVDVLNVEGGVTQLISAGRETTEGCL